MEWTSDLVVRLRDAGVQEITLRADKGFFSKELPCRLDRLGVRFSLKLPHHRWLQDHRERWRLNGRAEGAFSGAQKVYSSPGELWGFRLLALQGRRSMTEDGPTLKLDTYEVTDTAHILTNVPGIHVLPGWRRYNAGAVIEQLGQLSVGQTAVDDRDGNRLVWALGGLAYQMFHLLRTTALGRGWRGPNPSGPGSGCCGCPGRFTKRSGQLSLHVYDPDGLLKSVLRRLGRLRAPPDLLAA